MSCEVLKVSSYLASLAPRCLKFGQNEGPTSQFCFSAEKKLRLLAPVLGSSKRGHLSIPLAPHLWFLDTLSTYRFAIITRITQKLRNMTVPFTFYSTNLVEENWGVLGIRFLARIPRPALFHYFSCSRKMECRRWICCAHLERRAAKLRNTIETEIGEKAILCLTERKNSDDRTYYEEVEKCNILEFIIRTACTIDPRWPIVVAFQRLIEFFFSIELVH